MNDQAIALDLERQQLIRDCHSLVAEIAQKPYSNKLLKSARQSLLTCAQYKQHRR